ncbi:hypothetical protein [Bartonella sp. 1-1C]|nr:hypothetical protein [Bartonella sp. 1-1C]
MLVNETISIHVHLLMTRFSSDDPWWRFSFCNLVFATAILIGTS